MNSPDSLLLNSGWRRQIGPRVRLLWVSKMFATTLGISAFFVAYFWILRHPFFPITIMPITAIDRLVAFRPEALPLYASLWLYIALPPALLKDGREVRSYGLAAFALSVIGLSIFLVWPTAAPEFEIDWSQHPSMSFLKTMNVAANACPSLHAAFAVFTALWVERLLRELHVGHFVRALNWLWCLGILYSTLATRQHVALDTLAGAALGALIALLHIGALDRFATSQRTLALSSFTLTPLPRVRRAPHDRDSPQHYR
jgi:membrane-associated phospholipid phosphatase